MPSWTTPGYVASGEADSGKFNTETVDNLQYLYDQLVGAALGVWTSYTPTDSAITVGTGTRVARYQKLGPKTCVVSWSFVLGTGSAIGTNAAIGLPFIAAARRQVLTAYYLDAGTRNFPGVAKIASGGAVASLLHGDNTGAGALSATTPFTWDGSGGDEIVVEGIYEIA